MSLDENGEIIPNKQDYYNGGECIKNYLMKPSTQQKLKEFSFTKYEHPIKVETVALNLSFKEIFTFPSRQ